MKIACFWAEPRSLDRVSFRHEHLISGFAALGHEPALVTARAFAGRYEGPARLVDELDELASSAFWSASGFELAVGVTWLRKAAVLEAIAEAGIPRVAIADSDGQAGYAAHPRAAWRHLAASARGGRELLRAARYFVRRFRASRSGRDAEEREIVASARASSAIAFAGGPAIAAFRRFLARHGEGRLAERAFAAPFPVPAELLEMPIAPKGERIVAIGRWSDPQKDAPLLARALRLFVHASPTDRVEIFGADSESAFGELAASEPRVELRGVQEPHRVRESLARARILVIASRWETGPHVAGEALALGTTLVSTPLPTVEGLVEGGEFGELAESRSTRALARALTAESATWNSGRRDAVAIAAHWRARLSPTAYCRRLLESVSARPPAPASR